MPDLIKLLACFALIIILLRRKLRVGSVLLLASMALMALYMMPPRAGVASALEVLSAPRTWEFLLALVFIRIFEMTLRENNVLAQMTEAAKGILRNKKAVIVSMPLLIGMLPSIGGAYFSAPMVADATSDTDMQGEEKAFVNYWFRHPWEMVLPLYPGVLLASAVSGVPLGTLVLSNLPMALGMALVGFWASMRGVRGAVQGQAPGARGLWAFFPVALVLGLVMGLNVPAYIAFIVTVAGLQIHYRYGVKRVVEGLRYGFSADVVLLVFGVLLFKQTLEDSGAVQGMSHALSGAGIPLVSILIALPLLTGLLTGLTVGFVGASFPLLMGLPGGDALGAVVLAFASGYAGVLMSPVHVCLILTREYFDSTWRGIYRRMAAPVAVVLLIGIAEYLIFARFLS